MMKASELVRRHIDVAKNYKTVYMWGCFGSPVSETIIDEKSAQYPDWYTGGRVTYLRSLIGKIVYGFDCVNLTRAFFGAGTATKAPTTAVQGMPQTACRMSPPTA